MFAGFSLLASVPIPFSGKIALNGVNFHGDAKFAFSIVDGEGVVKWSHSDDSKSMVENKVSNGRYLVLLGEQGMNALPASLFLDESNLFLRVSVDLLDGKGVRVLSPDQRITASPYALTAEVSRLAQRATIADGVNAGSISAGMLEQSLLADLNRSSTSGSTVQAEVADGSIGLAQLSSEVTDKLNQTFSIDAGSITLDQLSQQVRDDINRTITRDRLSSDVLSDINRTITKSMLSQEVLDELNASGGSTGSVPGSLIAVPANQSAPSGYELYQMGDRKNLVWEEKAPVSVARYVSDGAEVIGNKIYLVSGSNTIGGNLAERYDPLTNTWETLSPMLVARDGVACAVLEGKLFAIGGIGLQSVEIYDPETDQWSAGVSLPSEVRNGTAITIEGKIYLFGGQDSSGNWSNQVLCFDPVDNQWVAKTPMPTARYGPKLVWYQNRLWVISFGNIVESYDPVSDTWQREASLTTQRNWPVAWTSYGRIYVAGGYYTEHLSSIEAYDPQSKSWTIVGNLPENKRQADAVVFNDKVYVIAGDTGNNTSTNSNKVFAADLNASVEGVHDLYVKAGDASTGTPTVQAEVADGSIGPSNLSSEVSNALKPVVIGQPRSVVGHAGMPTYLAVDATGGDNTYQWKKDGVDIVGASNKILSIADLNASQHEGNYTVVVSNAFGSVTSSVAQIDVSGSLTEGLVGWWKFDETEGTVASDSSGNGNGGTLINGPTWTDGKIGGALSFDGVDDYVNLGNVLPSSYSKVAWVKKTDTDNGNILSFDDSHALWITVDNYLAAKHFNPNLVELRDNALFPNNKWMHVCSTYEANTQVMSLLKNGSVIDSSGNVQELGANIQVFVGKYNSANFWTGLIDDIRIYDRALSAFEVKALYELGEQPVQESGSGATTVVNGTVADGSITKSMLSQEVLDELNASGGVAGSVPGSLIAVPADQSTPSGYELYQKGEPKELVWEEKASLSKARYTCDGVEALGGKIYIIGGFDGSDNLNLAERYDPQNNTWETLSPMSVARDGVSSAVLNGKLYAIGGEGLTSVEIFDPSQGSWSAGVSLPSEVHRGGAITVDSKIYLIGGRRSDQNINQVICFDPLTNLWTAKANMPTARHGMKLVWFENRIWAIGGHFDSEPWLKIVESYDPLTNSWQEEASLNSIRNWPFAWIAYNKIYVGGGKTSPYGQFLSSIEYYNPSAKNWTSLGSISENKYVADAAKVNDKIYVLAGKTGSSSYSNKVYAADLNASAPIDLYFKTGDASTGTPTVQAEVADGSIGPSKLSSEVSNALKPVVVGQPSSVVEVGGNPAYLAVDVDGANLSYQWKKDGVDIAGATGRTLAITDLNASQHEGNYTVVVSNAFGSVTSSVAQIDVNGSLTEGLVGWWKFDETEGNIAYDSSGNGNDGNLTNGPTWTVGKIGGALNFDGVDDRVKIPHTILDQKLAFTVSLWFNMKLGSDSSYHAFITAANSSDANAFTFEKRPNHNMMIRDMGEVSSSSAETSDFWTSTWRHVTLTKSSVGIVFYLSGEELDSKNYSTATMSVDANGLWIGPDQDSVGGGWQSGQSVKGELDDFRIYDRALSPFEVRALHELGEQPVGSVVAGSGATTVVNGTVADGSITTNQLSEQILKYLKPEITQQPTTTTIFAGSNHTISVSAEGKYLTYQWKKNGVNLTGETNSTLTITDANATQHDGNYSVVVSNDFGSVESGDAEIQISNSLMNGLIAWYPLDQNASDMSGRGNHGIVYGATLSEDRFGRANKAYSFNGTSNFIQVSYNSSLNDIPVTYSLWCKASQLNSLYGSPLTSRGHVSGMMFYKTPENKWYLKAGISGNQWSSSPSNISVEVDVWVNLVVTIDSLSSIFYVNANQAQVITDIVVNSSSPLRIGAGATEGSAEFFFDGSIDDVRIYDRALSSAEVQALYQLEQ